MNGVKTKLIFACLTALLISCNQQSNIDFEVPALSRSELFPGGETSVSNEPYASLMKPAANLPQALKPDFHAGKALAHQPWVKAPTITTARDGLGPLYNARTCLSCHVNGGRGRMPEDNSEVLFSAFLRLSIPGTDKINGVIPEPVYGDQLQSQSVALSHQLRTQVTKEQVANREVAPEAYVYVNWQQKSFQYPDGETVVLRYPKVDIQNLGYGDLHKETLMGIRVAPPIHGMGLLELIAQEDLNQLSDPKDKNNDGISGRVNQVWDFEARKTVPGRFGLKANKSSVRFQTAGAFVGDMGISNPVFSAQNCTDRQLHCVQTPNGNDVDKESALAVELPESLLKLVVDFTRNLGVPKRRNSDKEEVVKGREYFYQVGCQGCHQPSYVTGDSKELPNLSQQTIWPYSDLLLHDMGPELADGRPDYLATGSEWRTPPLWGVGLGEQVNGSKNLLHDGRAQSVEEAIIWHGGEAEKIKQNFIQLSKSQRQALIAFVESL